MVFEGGVSRRWLCHEGEILMNWISVLIKDSREFSYPFLPWEDKPEDFCLWTRRGLSLGTKSSSALILNCQPPELWKIIQSMVICYSSPEQTKTGVCFFFFSAPKFSPVNPCSTCTTCYLYLKVTLVHSSGGAQRSKQQSQVALNGHTNLMLCCREKSPNSTGSLWEGFPENVVIRLALQVCRVWIDQW